MLKKRNSLISIHCVVSTNGITLAHQIDSCVRVSENILEFSRNKEKSDVLRVKFTLFTLVAKLERGFHGESVH